MRGRTIIGFQGIAGVHSRCGIVVARQPFYPLPSMSMKDEQAVATKADIHALMEHIDGSIKDLYDANERWKDEILKANERWKEEILRHFDVTVETIRHDLEGAHRDDIQLLKDTHRRHEERLMRLERHVGLAA